MLDKKVEMKNLEKKGKNVGKKMFDKNWEKFW